MNNITSQSTTQYQFLRYSYIIDRLNFKDKCLLLYSVLEYLFGSSEIDKKYEIPINEIKLSNRII